MSVDCGSGRGCPRCMRRRAVSVLGDVRLRPSSRESLVIASAAGLSAGRLDSSCALFMFLVFSVHDFFDAGEDPLGEEAEVCEDCVTLGHAAAECL